MSKGSSKGYVLAKVEQYKYFVSVLLYCNLAIKRLRTQSVARITGMFAVSEIHQLISLVSIIG